MATHRVRRLVIFSLILAAVGPRAGAADPATTSSFPFGVSSGSTLARSGDTLFVSSFGASVDLRRAAIGLVVVSAIDGTSDPMPALGGASVVIADGRGGWFVGGSASGQQVVHVLASGAVDAGFRVAVGSSGSGYVTALALLGMDLVVGGYFDAANGVPRANVAIVDAATGAVRPAAPAVTIGPVFDVAATATRLYVVGDFATAGGQPRRNIAAFDLATGALASGFVAETDAVGTVSSVVVAGGAVFIGGSFSAVNGIARSRLARLDATTGQLAAAWNPGADGIVVDLATAGGTLYVAGAFTTVGGQPRVRLAAIDPASGAVTSWRADADNLVLGLALDGGALFAVGTFTTVGGAPRLGAAAISPSAPASVLPWNPSILAAGRIATSAGRVGMTGGSILGSNVTVERGLAAFDLRSGRRLSWSPEVNDQIRSMVTTGTRLVIAGDFTRVANEARHGLAAFDLTTLDLLPLSISVNGPVHAMTAAGDVLYLGGEFSTVNGAKRLNLAAIDVRTGQLLPWAPLTDHRVRTLSIGINGVIAGGEFTTIASSSGLLSRSGLAEIRFDGAVTPLDAAIPTGVVSMVATSGNRVYFVGTFTMVQGNSRRHAAALDLATRTLLPWAPDPDAQVYDVRVHRGFVYLGGFFTSAGGLLRRGVARVTDGSAAPSPWAPTFLSVRAVAPFDDGVAVTGSATGLYGAVHFFPEDGLAGQPGPPVRPAARVEGASLRLDWHGPVLGPRPTGYLLEAGSGPGLSNIGTIPITSSSFAIGGVPPGLYYVRVRAVGPGGTSAPSEELAFAMGATTCLTPPTTPDPLSAVVTGSSLLLKWSAASGSPPTGYRLDVGSSEGSRNLGTLPMGGAMSVSASGVPAGVYFVRVVASNACGDSAPSADARVSVGGAAGPPGAPLQVSSVVAGATVTFSWLSSAVGSPVSGHVLEAGTGPGLSNLAVVPLPAATGFGVSGVPSGTYYVRIRAANGAGLGPPSGEHLLIVP